MSDIPDDLDDLPVPPAVKAELLQQFTEWEKEYRKALDEFFGIKSDKDKEKPSTDWRSPPL